MSISSVNQTSSLPLGNDQSRANTEKAFKKLSTALESGNLTDAKSAVAQLKANAPANATDKNNPMAAKIETLTKAVESGDLKGAQAALKDIKDSAPKGAPRGMPPAGAGKGGGAAPAGGSASTASTSSSSKTYDVKDTNEDGKVSAKEQMAYDMKVAEQKKAESGAASAENEPSYASIRAVDVSA